MSAISKVYKKYGDIVGKQYLSVMYSIMLAMSRMSSEEEQKAYATRSIEYIRSEYGEDFLQNYHDFFVEYSGNKSLLSELDKNRATFLNKQLTVDLVNEPKSKEKEPPAFRTSSRNQEKQTSENKPNDVPATNQPVNSNDFKKTRNDTDYKREYREASFKNNPFNVLNLKCDASRQDIAAAVEENEFLIGSEKCTAAQGLLSNPTKRLAAELDWFPDINDLLSAFLRSCVNQDLVIPLTSLGGISKLNAMLFNLTLNNSLAGNELCEQVQTIDRDYCALDAESTKQLINLIHEKARIGQVANSDVERELGRKRENISRLLSELLQGLSKTQYVSCVTKLAETFRNVQDSSGVIISDIIDQYEVWVQSELATQMGAIDRDIDSVKKGADSEVKVKSLVTKLISDLKEWNRYAYPLEIRTGQTGIDNSDITNLAYKLRSLSLFLNNEKNLTECAASLTSEIKQIFAQLPEVSARLEKDDKDLRGILQERQEQEEEEKKHRQPDQFYTVTVSGTSYSVPPVCTCCLKPTSGQEIISHSYQTYRGRTRTTHTTSVRLPVCPECLKHRDEHRKRTSVTRVLAALIGAIVAFLIMVLVKPEDKVAVFVGLLVAVGMHFLLFYVRREKALPEEHSTRLKSVSILPSSVYGGQGITFIFTNWKYAQLFQKANEDNASGVSEGRRRLNPAKAARYLEIDESKWGSAFITVFVFLLFAVILAGYNASSHNGINKIYPDSPLAVSSKRYSDSGNTNPTRTKAPSGGSQNTGNGSSAKQTEKPTAKPTAKPTEKPKEETVYTSSSVVGDLAYADVVSIFPEYSIYTEGSLFYNAFVCRCVTRAGETRWIYFTASEYKTHIDKDISTIKSTNYYADKKQYSPGLRIHGSVRRADSITDNLSNSIGSYTVLSFASKEIYKGEDKQKKPTAKPTKKPTNKPTATPKASKSTQTITLKADNVKKYFDITMIKKQFERGKGLTLSYLITPRSSSYALQSKSSADVVIKFQVNVHAVKGKSKTTQSKEFTVILKKSNGYKASSNQLLVFRLDYKDVDWDYKIVSCSGTIVD